MKKFLIILSLIFSVNSFAVDYKAGQKWAYKNRFLEGSSTLTILKVEKYDDLGVVVHIRVDDISMINPIKGNEINEIPHLPFKKAGIDASVTILVDEKVIIPNFKEGYETWKSAYDQGMAGAFDTSVAETLTALLGADWIEKK